jgi:hypothetical protein
MYDPVLPQGDQEQHAGNAHRPQEGRRRQRRSSFQQHNATLNNPTPITNPPPRFGSAPGIPVPRKPAQQFPLQNEPLFEDKFFCKSLPAVVQVVPRPTFQVDQASALDIAEISYLPMCNSTRKFYELIPYSLFQY